MKIFNWVHKAFHHSATKDHGFASNMKKTVPNVIIGDSQALLKEVALADVVGGWKDGILTIGTLGYYDPLKPFNQHKDYLAFKSDEDEMDEQDGEDEDSNCYNAAYEAEELNPLMHTTFEHNFEDVLNEKSDDDDANASIEEAMVTLTPPVVSHEITEAVDVGTDSKKKGERITLADLFLADSDKIMKQEDTANVLLDQPSEKPSLKAKHGLPTFAKKLIPRVHKDNPHPIKNIRKLMKKMMKKKIHPEIDVKDQKPEGQNQKIEANDSLSLLPV